MKTVNGCYKLQKVLKDEANVTATLQKVIGWLESFSGDNEEGALTYLQNQYKEVLSKH